MSFFYFTTSGRICSCIETIVSKQQSFFQNLINLSNFLFTKWIKHIVLCYFDLSISGKILNDFFRSCKHYSLVKNNTSFKSDSDFCIILIHTTSEKSELFKTGLIVLHSIFLTVFKAMLLKSQSSENRKIFWNWSKKSIREKCHWLQNLRSKCEYFRLLWKQKTKWSCLISKVNKTVNETDFMNCRMQKYQATKLIRKAMQYFSGSCGKC